MRRRFLSNINKSISEYFTIKAYDDGLTVSLSQNSCEYSLDGVTWINLPASTYTPAINIGENIYFKATGLVPNSDNGIGTFTINRKCILSGNIMSLLFGDNFEGQTDLSGYDYAFYKLFYDCTLIIDTSQLILPATTLANYCYSDMFYWCIFLITAPKLPAINLSQGCYDSMFYGCTSLVTAPELPAINLTYNCYKQMFYDCTKLNYIKALFVTIPNLSCTYDWVNRVSSTGTFVKSKDATWNVTGANGIPEGWTVQTV